MMGCYEGSEERGKEVLCSPWLTCARELLFEW